MEKKLVVERKLAVVKEITSIQNIDGADFIELAEVDKGWKCVVKKGEFKVGDLGLYFEIDSFLPIKEEFEFLRSRCFKKMGDKEGFRLKTGNFKGHCSQGLLLSVSSMKNLIPENETIVLHKDFTDIIGVDKYEAPIPACLAGDVNGTFPTNIIRKTDQERIQNLYMEYSNDYSDNNEEIIKDLELREISSNSLGLYSKDIERLKTNRKINVIKNLFFEVSVKLDGTSMTSFVVDPKKYRTKHIEELELENKLEEQYFGVCGRNYELKEVVSGNSYWTVANRDIKNKLIDFHKKTGRSIAVQGELMGEGIQKNREKLKGQKFFCFEIWDIDNQRYLTRDEREEILNELLIESVPIIGNIQVFKVFNSLEEILLYAEGKSLNAEVREGLVFKSLTLVNGHTVSFKAISNQFLLKNE